MIGENYWATGITVRYGYSGMGFYGWGATADFYDSGFCDDNTDTGTVSTQGTIRTRYFVREGTGADADGLTAAIDAIKRDAGRLGIRFGGHGTSPTVYYEGDGEDSDWPPPDGWRGMVNAQAERLGWRPLYATEGKS
jgi:hypothetical protein